MGEHVKDSVSIEFGLSVNGELYAISLLFSERGQCLARFIESFLPAGETYQLSLFGQQPRVEQQS